MQVTVSFADQPIELKSNCMNLKPCLKPINSLLLSTVTVTQSAQLAVQLVVRENRCLAQELWTKKGLARRDLCNTRTSQCQNCYFSHSVAHFSSFFNVFHLEFLYILHLQLARVVGQKQFHVGYLWNLILQQELRWLCC